MEVLVVALHWQIEIVPPILEERIVEERILDAGRHTSLFFQLSHLYFSFRLIFQNIFFKVLWCKNISTFSPNECEQTIATVQLKILCQCFSFLLNNAAR